MEPQPAKLIALEQTAKSFPQLSVVEIKPRAGRTEFWIGRHNEADLPLLDPTVSRHHANFKYSKNSWAIIDRKSSNGVYINDTRIPVSEYINVKDNDKISIDNSTYENSKYEWVLSVSSGEPSKKSLSDSILIEKEKITDTHKQTVLKIKEEKNNLEKKASEIEKERILLNKQKEQLRKIVNEEKTNFAQKQSQQYDKFKADLKYATGEVILKERIAFESRLKEEKRIADLKLAEKEKCLSESIKEAESRLQALINEKDDIIMILEFETEHHKEQIKQMRSDFENHIAQLSNDCEKEKTNAQQHKLEIEDMKRNFDDVLKQSEKEMNDIIGLLKADAEKERAEKENMISELKERDEEIAKLKEALKAKTDSEKHSEEIANHKQALKIKENSKEMLDLYSKCNEELKCSICDELFIEPMALGCGHVYCSHCLKQWEVNCGNCFGKFNCPNCREPILQFNKSLHLENLISSVVNGLSETLKKERESLVRERKAEESSAKEKLEAEKRQREHEQRQRNQRRRSRRARGGRNGAVEDIREAFLDRLREHQRNQRESTNQRRRNLEERVSQMRTRLLASEVPNSPPPDTNPNTRLRVRNRINSIRQRLITEMTSRIAPNTDVLNIAENDDVQVVSARTRQGADNRRRVVAPSTIVRPPVIDLEAEGEVETHDLDTTNDDLETTNESNRGTTNMEGPSNSNDSNNEGLRSGRSQSRSRTRSRTSSSDSSSSSDITRTRNISISSQSSLTSDNTNTDLSDSQEASDSSVEGIQGVFYGGYGECYRCGRRGHWAPGCPF